MQKNDASEDVVSLVKTKGWGTALSVVFSAVAVTVTCVYFLYQNFSSPKEVEAVRTDQREAITLLRSDYDSKFVQVREDQKSLQAENIRLRTEVRDELRELRGLVIQLVQRKKYSFDLDELNRDRPTPFFKQAKSGGL